MNSFILRQAEGVTYYACTAFERDPGLRHGFSTRRGGVSVLPEGALNLGYVAGDSRDSVVENRRRFLSALGLGPECLATVAQVHSAEFHIITTGVRQWNPHTRGDALVTALQGVALAVQVADCFPVLISDPISGVIAAVHAGWRGALARILRRTLEGMRDRLGVDPAHALVAIGPGIRSCCLEVGAEVASAFDAAFPGVRLASPRPEHQGKYLLDLPLSLGVQLWEAGVPATNVFSLGLCTRCCSHEFFSYRADGSGTGRMMAVICRGEPSGAHE